MLLQLSALAGYGLMPTCSAGSVNQLLLFFETIRYNISNNSKES